MYISRFQIGNYKSFVESPELNLGLGFNIFCGQNNAGKTALLEALAPNAMANPHRSMQTAPTPRSQPTPVSWLNVSFSLSREELFEICSELGPETYRLPLPRLGSAFAAENGYQNSSIENVEKLARWFLSQNNFVFRLHKDFTVNGSSSWRCQGLPSFGLYDADPAPTRRFGHFAIVADGSPGYFSLSNDSSLQDIGTSLLSGFERRVYRFNAERLNIGISGVGSNPSLHPNASNLAEVLLILQGNLPRLNLFNRLLNEVFPQIKGISVRPLDSQRAEIRLWTFDPVPEREHLTVPLAHCGTGIGQVLAILYVVLFSQSPQAIVIDEPQSFLHPGAISKLIQVLKSHPQHQYIVATHSPAVISAADPVSITVAKIVDGASVLETIDPKEAKSLRIYLAEIGARLSDVFGADNILWVEGSTEELCFPMILERIARVRLQGTSIVAVSNTGDLTTPDANRVFDMYGRLSQRNSLLPPAIGFIFDSDGRTEAQKQEMIRRSNDLLEFLPCRMYENYLLNPRAIAAVANQIEGFSEIPIEVEQVSALIETLKSDPKYVRPLAIHLTEDNWTTHINGALVLKELFTQLSNTRVSFDKIIHDVPLTEWLIEHDRESLVPLSELIVRRLGQRP